MRVLAYEDLKSEKGVSYSKPHIWRLEGAGLFPMHIKLGPGRNGWIESEVDAWIKAKIAERDSGNQA